MSQMAMLMLQMVMLQMAMQILSQRWIHLLQQLFPRRKIRIIPYHLYLKKKKKNMEIKKL